MSATVAAPPPIKNFEDLRPEVTDALLSKVTGRIVAQFDPEQVILFGSYAYGTPHEDSDVDLFVIMESDEDLFRRSFLVRMAVQVDFLAMDVIARTPKEVAERLEMGDYFMKEIIERGRVLYRRDVSDNGMDK